MTDTDYTDNLILPSNATAQTGDIGLYINESKMDFMRL